MKIEFFSRENLPNVNKDLLLVFGNVKEYKQCLPQLEKISNEIIYVSSGSVIVEEEIKDEISFVSLEFEKTKKEIVYSFDKEPFLMGEEIAKAFSKKPDLLLLFVTGVKTNAEEVLEGIKSVYDDLKIFGGLSGDNNEFKHAYVGIKEKIFSKGVIGIGLFNKDLKFEIRSFLGWIPIGMDHTITKADKNIIYEIDGKKAIELFTEYIGKNYISKMPEIGIEFPLLVKRGHGFIARAVLGVEDGHLILGGNVKEGDKIYLGIGYPKNLLKNHLKSFKLQNPECFFLIPCIGRRKFMGELITKEISPFSKTAPSFGFFSFGEINGFQFLNHTLTVLALSENGVDDPAPFKNEIEIVDNFNGIINILNNVIKKLKQKENRLRALEKELEIKEDLLNKISVIGKIGMFEVKMKNGKVVLSDELSNFDIKCMSLKECMKLLSKEERKAIFDFLKSDKDEASFEIFIKGHYYILNLKKEKNRIYTLLVNIDMIKKKDEMLIAQSRLAQMGEMVNMIAHQWRQPINAISASLIRLEILLESLCNEEVFNSSKEIIDFINKVIQGLSNTIDEFLYFSKPISKLEDVNMKEIIHDVLRLVNTQLQNHNIIVEVEVEDITFRSYKKEIEHIVLNLITNARDVLDERKEENKKITIRGYKKGENVIIEIEDNAGGVKVQPIEKIFEPYFTTKSQGTGLGLYMSKNIAIKKLNGDLRVENTSEGAKFTLIIGGTKVDEL